MKLPTQETSRGASLEYQRGRGLLGIINHQQHLPLVKPPPATTTVRGLVRTSGWNFLRCAYMVITFFFVSYNKGDWVRREPFCLWREEG
jgi:hypothetical protein